jgi:hypothetical protein
LSIKPSEDERIGKKRKSSKCTNTSEQLKIYCEEKVLKYIRFIFLYIVLVRKFLATIFGKSAIKKSGIPSQPGVERLD